MPPRRCPFERLWHACRCRWEASGRTWRGHVLGLSRASLRYPTGGDETAFLVSTSDSLCGVLRNFLIIAILVNAWAMVFVMDVPTDAADPAYRVKLHQYVTRCVCTGVAMIFVAVISVPRLLRRIGVPWREKAALLMLLLYQVTAFDKYYMAKLYGRPDPEVIFPELAGHTDSLILMQFCIYLLAGHFIPVRWFLLVALQATAVAMYGTCVLILGSPEPRAVSSLVLFVVFVVLIAIGKRQSEVNERLVFSAFLAEKTLRMQAEFELSQAVPPRNPRGAVQGGDGDEAEVARVPTTVSGEAFRGLGCEMQAGPSLEMIWEIGKREQWLISQWDVVAHPHVCLGSGGFGIVVAGEYHGSPVALKLHAKTATSRPLFDIGNELRMLRRLRHPNIVLFHGACINMAQRDMVLVMERLVGKTMPQFLACQPPAVDRWKLLVDICRALMHLHSRRPPVAHGDLKPTNVIVETRGEGVLAKLLDFGLSRLLTRSAKLGGGTYRWMAPGTLMSNRPVKVENDVFSYGLVTYFTATGQRPFDSLGDKALKAYATDRGTACPTLDWPDEMPGFVVRCKSVVDSCTRKLCEERPPMERVHESLLGFDECTRRGTGGPGSRSAAQPDLWQQLSLARHIAMHSAHTRVLRMKGNPRKKQAALGGPGHLSSVPELDIVGGADAPGPACEYPHASLHPTPADTVLVSIMDTLLSWNHALALDRCCTLHSAIHVASCLCTELAGGRCGQMRLTGMHVSQCPACWSVLYSEGEPGEVVFCKWCQYEGPPSHDAHAVAPELVHEGRVSL